MNQKTILIIGAKSDLAIAVAYKFAKEGFNIQLAGRQIDDLSEMRADIKFRFNVNVSMFELDILNLVSFENFFKDLNTMPDIALCAVGLLGNQQKDQKNIDQTSLVMKTNFEAPAIFLGLLANIFEERKFGTIIGISSVAGERGRGSNYIYGSAKSGFTAFLSGLRNRLHPSNVRVISIIPGFIATKMTKNLELPSLLTANTNKLANKIYIVYCKGGSDIIFYKYIWTFIMMIIRLLPEKIFKKLNL